MHKLTARWGLDESPAAVAASAETLPEVQPDLLPLAPEGRYDLAQNKDGSCCAAISGTWNAKTAQDTWGDNYAATKLPTYTLNGEQVQMASFSGYKLVGVNPHSANVGVAMMLADYITNEDNQAKRFNDRQLGPSNIAVNESEAVQSAPAIAALAEQSDYATLQRVGANYWSSAASLGEILVSGDTQGKTTQQLVDDAVAGITAPVAQ